MTAQRREGEKMQLTEAVVEGTLRPDGTLELDARPGLPPGRVTVVLRQETPAATQEGWWPAMQRARQEMEAAGCRFLNDAEMQARIDELREEDRIDEMLRERDEQRRQPE
jgi:hypothetical protein